MCGRTQRSLVCPSSLSEDLVSQHGRCLKTTRRATRSHACFPAGTQLVMQVLLHLLRFWIRRLGRDVATYAREAIKVNVPTYK